MTDRLDRDFWSFFSVNFSLGLLCYARLEENVNLFVKRACMCECAFCSSADIYTLNCRNLYGSKYLKSFLVSVYSAQISAIVLDSYSNELWEVGRNILSHLADIGIH